MFALCHTLRHRPRGEALDYRQRRGSIVASIVADGLVRLDAVSAGRLTVAANFPLPAQGTRPGLWSVPGPDCRVAKPGCGGRMEHEPTAQAVSAAVSDPCVIFKINSQSGNLAGLWAWKSSLGRMGSRCLMTGVLRRRNFPTANSPRPCLSPGPESDDGNLPTESHRLYAPGIYRLGKSSTYKQLLASSFKGFLAKFLLIQAPAPPSRR